MSLLLDPSLPTRSISLFRLKSAWQWCALSAGIGPLVHPRLKRHRSQRPLHLQDHLRLLLQPWLCTPTHRLPLRHADGAGSWFIYDDFDVFKGYGDSWATSSSRFPRRSASLCCTICERSLGLGAEPDHPLRCHQGDSELAIPLGRTASLCHRWPFQRMLCPLRHPHHGGL